MHERVYAFLQEQEQLIKLTNKLCHMTIVSLVSVCVCSRDMLVVVLTPVTTSHSGVLWLVVVMIGLLLCQLK